MTMMMTLPPEWYLVSTHTHGLRRHCTHSIDIMKCNVKRRKMFHNWWWQIGLMIYHIWMCTTFGEYLFGVAACVPTCFPQNSMSKWREPPPHIWPGINRHMSTARTISAIKSTNAHRFTKRMYKFLHVHCAVNQCQHHVVSHPIWQSANISTNIANRTKRKYSPINVHFVDARKRNWCRFNAVHVV